MFLSQLLFVKKTHTPKWHIVGWHVLPPSILTRALPVGGKQETVRNPCSGILYLLQYTLNQYPSNIPCSGILYRNSHKR